MSTVMVTDHLRLTVAHHDDNEFYDLGTITHETDPETFWQYLLSHPETQCCRATDSGHNVCYLIDQMDAADDLGDSREITREQAEALLGRPITEAINEARERQRAVYAYLNRRKGTA